MILPTKRLPEDRALIGIGGGILQLLDERKTISRLWDEFKRSHDEGAGAVSFDWFVLALDLLFMMGTVTLERGLVKRTGP